MARRFVVEVEAVALVSDLAHAALERDPRQRRCLPLACIACTFAEDRTQRVDREHVLDVGHEQFLVLLLVVQSDLDQPGDFARHIALQQLRHVGVDVGAVGHHIGDGRTAEVPAPIAAVALTGLDVVAVEQVRVLRMERRVAG